MIGLKRGTVKLIPYDPEWDKNNLYDLYSKILFVLDSFSSLFPEDISIIEEALNCKSERAAECIKKWGAYWSDKDLIEREAEGVKRGYWEAEEKIDLPHLVALSKLFTHDNEKKPPNYNKLREDILNIIDKYKKGDINLSKFHWELSDLEDEYFIEDDPNWGEGNLNDLYLIVLFKLHGFISELLPEDIVLIEETLNCKSENAQDCIKKWDEYWRLKDIRLTEDQKE